MKDCKNYEIFKFHYAVDMSIDDGAENWKRANEYTEFRLEMFDRFSGMTRRERWEKFGFDAREETTQLLEDTRGIIHTNQWRSSYWLVPKADTEAVEFFEKNKPDWVTKVSKI